MLDQLPQGPVSMILTNTNRRSFICLKSYGLMEKKKKDKTAPSDCSNIHNNGEQQRRIKSRSPVPM